LIVVANGTLAGVDGTGVEIASELGVRFIVDMIPGMVTTVNQLSWGVSNFLLEGQPCPHRPSF
jgi:hypothetical protein